MCCTIGCLDASVHWCPTASSWCLFMFFHPWTSDSLNLLWTRILQWLLHFYLILWPCHVEGFVGCWLASGTQGNVDWKGSPGAHSSFLTHLAGKSSSARMDIKILTIATESSVQTNGKIIDNIEFKMKIQSPCLKMYCWCWNHIISVMAPVQLLHLKYSRRTGWLVRPTVNKAHGNHGKKFMVSPQRKDSCR